jgi:6-phosphogluconolactonase
VSAGGDDQVPARAVVEERFATREDSARALAAAVGNDLAGALASRGRASLAVPGGTTPRAFLRELGRATLDWPRISVTLTDERWVPLDHPDSNERMVRAELFCGPASTARWIGLHELADDAGGGADPAAALVRCAARIAPLLPFDVVVLGMGEDGHFASLFPGDPSLSRFLDPENAEPCGIARAPGVAGGARLTLLAPALFSARFRYLLITGEAKLAVYRRALAGASASELPVAAALRAGASPLRVYWSP